MARQYTLTTLKPECARKLVEGAVRYADDLGLPPHEDYRIAKKIFGDVRGEHCTEEHVFGKEGKPFFCSGPNDSRAKCEQVIRILHNHCGEGGYHFLVGGDWVREMAEAGIDDDKRPDLPQLEAREDEITRQDTDKPWALAAAPTNAANEEDSHKIGLGNST